MSIWTCFSFSTIGRVELGLVQRGGVHGGHMHGDLAGEALVPAGEGDENADLAHAGRGGVVDIGHDVVAGELGHAAQRHVLADLGDGVGQDGLDRVLPSRSAAFSASVSSAAARPGDLRDHALELGVLGDEVGLGVDLDRDGGAALGATATRPSAAVRPDFLAALARPLVRSQSTAASMSPSVSVSAFLASIMPAPVDSRSSFTCAAVIAMGWSPDWSWSGGVIPLPSCQVR
jgi:hypothetical protein